MFRISHGLYKKKNRGRNYTEKERLDLIAIVERYYCLLCLFGLLHKLFADMQESLKIKNRWHFC